MANPLESNYFGPISVVGYPDRSADLPREVSVVADNKHRHREGVEATISAYEKARDFSQKISAEHREAYLKLSQTWQEETKDLSFIHQKMDHPAFKEIVSMGETAIPLILEDAKQNPSWLFVALYELTGEDPTHEDESITRKGGFVVLDIDTMRQDWIKWGEDKGYLDREIK